MRLAPALSVLVFAVLASCEKEGFDPPSNTARVLEASELFEPAMFDTLEWESRDRMLVTGAALFGADCRDCHGSLGRGGTAYASEHGLDVPSLVEPAWQYDGNLDAVRRLIFTGHTGGMPTHGIAGLTAREIDAVARYIVEQLRPEIIRADGTSRP